MADFKLTAEEFAKESKSDEKAFRAKYKNKIIELTGTVWRRRVPFGDVLLNGYKSNPKELVGTPVSCSPPEKHLEQIRRLALDQQVTIRGKQVDATYPALVECEFVKVGPSTAIPVTVAGFVAEYKRDEKAARKKYTDKSVVLRVKVVDTKIEDDFVLWTVSDPTEKGTAKLKVKVNTRLDELLARAKAVKANDTVLLMADPFDELELWCPVLLKEPPAGVKLPNDEK